MHTRVLECPSIDKENLSAACQMSIYIVRHLRKSSVRFAYSHVSDSLTLMRASDDCTMYQLFFWDFLNYLFNQTLYDMMLSCQLNG